MKSQPSRLATKESIPDAKIPLLPISDIYIDRPKSRKRWIWCLPLIGLLLLAVQAMAKVEPDWAQMGAGEFWLTNERQQMMPAPLQQKTQVSVKVSGMLAHVRMEQQFINPSDDWVEGSYLFPLPEKAAVSRFEIHIGERRIKGVIKEKDQAQRIYTKAKAAGKKAGLLTQQRPNLFTSRVANIGPHERVRVQLEYIEQVQYQAGIFSLRIPTTLTPRYLAQGRQKNLRRDQQPAAAPPSLQLDGQGWGIRTTASADLVSSPFKRTTEETNRFGFRATIDMGMTLATVESLYHPFSLQRHGSQYVLQLASADAAMDRDLVLNWRAANGLPQAGLFRERLDGEDYGLLMLIPPTVNAEANLQGVGRIAKEMVYVIDTSGSMSGTSIRQARKALQRSLQRLHPGDYFNVIEFNSHSRSLFADSHPATRQNIQLATYFVGSLEADGGTEMLPALRQALRPSMIETEANETLLRQVIFITDGAVNNEAALMDEVSAHLGNKRLFTVGIGSAPNSHFMRKMAQFGRGTFTYIGDIGEVENRVDALFQQLEWPQLTDIHIDWPANAVVEHYPDRVPDLYAGEPLVILFKAAELTGPVQVRGRLADQPWSQQLRITSTAELPKPSALINTGISRRWAREKIASLLDQRAAGQDPEQIRSEVLAVALKYQVMSPFTSFIAVEETVSRSANQSLQQRQLANNLPKGQQAPMAYPKTATGADLMLLQGLLLLLLALLTYGSGFACSRLARRAS